MSAGAESSSVTVIPCVPGISVLLQPRMSSGSALQVFLRPPTSDQIIIFWPCGPTSSMSMSSGPVWRKSLMRTVSLLIVEPMPDTLSVDG